MPIFVVYAAWARDVIALTAPAANLPLMTFVSRMLTTWRDRRDALDVIGRKDRGVSDLMSPRE